AVAGSRSNTRSFGGPGGRARGRAKAAAFWMPTLISCRASSVFARLDASGTVARSGKARALVWSTATTSPESSAPRQVDRIDAIEMIRRDEAAGTGHVLDDERRISGNVPAHVTREHARVRIESAAGREAHDQADGLALVE